jgi:hypothetical protein
MTFSKKTVCDLYFGLEHDNASIFTYHECVKLCAECAGFAIVIVMARKIKEVPREKKASECKTEEIK